MQNYLKKSVRNFRENDLGRILGLIEQTDYGIKKQFRETITYRHLDLDGRRYRLDNLKGAGTRTGSSGMPWRGVPNDSGSHWAVPNRLIPEESARGKSRS